MKCCLICGNLILKRGRKTCCLGCRKKLCSINQEGFERIKVDNILIIKLYNQGKSRMQISRIIKKDHKLVKRRLLKFGVPLKNLNEQMKISLRNSKTFKHGKRCGERDYLKLARDKLKWECSICGKDKEPSNKRDLSVHHINEIHTDNRLENLMVVCQSCHLKIHWTIKKANKF